MGCVGPADTHTSVFSLHEQPKRLTIYTHNSQAEMDTIYYQPNITTNKQNLQRVQDIMSLALGVGAGVLCLESLLGFLFFLVGFSLSNLSFFVLCCQGEPQTFFKNPFKEIFLDGIVSSLAGYVMMWCLTYALVK